MYVFAYDINKKGVSLQANMANKNNNELEKRNQAFLIYQDENGIARVNVRFESEQDPNRTHKKFLLVRQEGNRSVRREWSKMSGDSPLAAYRIDCIGDTDSTGRYELRRSVRKKQKPSTKFGGFIFYLYLCSPNYFLWLRFRLINLVFSGESQQ